MSKVVKKATKTYNIIFLNIATFHLENYILEIYKYINYNIRKLN